MNDKQQQKGPGELGPSFLTVLTSAVRHELGVLEQGLKRAVDAPGEDDRVIRYATALASVKSRLAAIAIEMELKARPMQVVTRDGAEDDVSRDLTTRLRRGPRAPDAPESAEG